MAPFFESSKEPRAMLIVNIVGRATGIAETRRITVRGAISVIGIPLRKASPIPNPTEATTMIRSHLTTFEIISSMCSLGFAIWTSSAVRPK